MTVTIRNCEKEDFKSISKLLGQLWPGKNLEYEQLEAVFKGILAEDNALVICAEDEGALIGFCLARISQGLYARGNYCEIEKMVVEDTYRSRGIGRMMVDCVESWSADNNCAYIAVTSAANRERAHRFYERYSYENKGYVFIKDLE